jgi:exopolysaccharide biosynthesis polyprenyl glycosylphosphotransferase
MSVALRRPAQRSLQHSQTTSASWEARYGRRLVIADCVIVLFAAFSSNWISGPHGIAQIWSVTLAALWMAMLAVFGSRSTRVLGTGSTEFRRIFEASFATFGLLAIASYLFDLQLARGYFLVALPLGLFALLIERWSLRQWLRGQRAMGAYASRAILVGSAASVSHIAKELTRHPEAGYIVLGACVAPGDNLAEDLWADVELIGYYDKLVEAVETSGADTVIVTSSDHLTADRVRRLSWQLEPGRQHLIVAPSLTDIGGPRIHTRPVAGLPLIHVETPRYEGRKQYTKRLFDIVASGLLIALLSPVLALVAIGVRLSTPGPLLFKQPRVGLNGDLFTMLKFRSMIPDAEKVLATLHAETENDRDAGNSILFKMKDDPRVTPIGRILRRYSIDELPQLFNVFLGSMSLVGPRPSLAREAEQYERHVHRRFLVKPGITGLWQVSGRSNLSWEESVRLDLYYVENWTLTGDLIILWKTVRAVFASQGAY